MDWSQESLSSLCSQQARGRRVIPFIGAGFSASCGYPTWAQFLERCVGYIDEHAREELAAVLRTHDYELAAQTLQARLPHFEEHIRSTFGIEHAIPSDSAVRLVPRIWRDFPVITTNFDRVLERVYEEASIPFQWCTYHPRGRPIREAREQGHRCLLKIHGDALDPATRVFTSADYKRGYQGASEIPEALTELFAKESIVFLGCSLLKDRYLEVLDRVGGRATHYAVLPQDGQPRELEKRSIRPIWYPRGEHSSVTQILEAIADGRVPQPNNGLTILVELREGDQFDLLAYLRSIPQWLPDSAGITRLLTSTAARIPYLSVSRVTQEAIELRAWPQLRTIHDLHSLESVRIDAGSAEQAYDYSVRNIGTYRVTVSVAPHLSITLSSAGNDPALTLRVQAITGPVRQVISGSTVLFKR